MKKIISQMSKILPLLLLCSCAATKYHLKGGVQQTKFKELTTTDTESFTGYNIGLTETTKYLIAAINYSSTDFTLEDNGIENNLSFSGIDFSIGLNFKYIKPRYTFGSMKLENDDFSRLYDISGFGAMFSYPINPKVFAFLSYDALKAKPNVNPLGTLNSFDYDRIILGIRFYIGSLGGSSNNESSPSR